ncbi:MAG: helix-hairpin-helix domain-containing protein [Planctomycetota bacterium]|nr:helix-hairpin-helix domain-containing protein [Planctomycetota bacterium]
MIARTAGSGRATSRGVVLMLTLVVITMGALAGTTMLVRSDAERSVSVASAEDLRLRSLAWSGVRGALAEVQSQRDAILDGGSPQLTSEWVLWEEGGRRGVVRLLEISDTPGDVAASENARLDLNRADAPMLAKLPGVGEDLARAIVAARGAAGFASPASLGAVAGVDARAFWGVSPGAEGEEGEESSDGRDSGGGRTSARDDAAATGDGAPDDSAQNPDGRGMRHLVTTFAFDPDTWVGISREGRGERGRERVHASAGWSDEVRDELKGQVSSACLDALALVLSRGKLASESDVVAAMIAAGVATETWAEVLDVVTTTDNEFRLGTVDVGRAPRKVLGCIPGFDESAADRAVSVRQGLTAETLRSPVWLVTQSVLTPEAFAAAAPWVTSRSMVWRVRVEASIERAGEREGDAARVERQAEWEAVIDAAGDEARLADVVDVTHVPAQIRRARPARAGRPEPSSERAPEPPSPGREPAKADDRPPGAREEKDQAPENRPVDVADGGAPEQPAGPPAKQDRRIGRWRGGSR